MMIQITDYPQLAYLCWSMPHVREIPPDVAFGLYEREWRHVDIANLTAREQLLIDNLTKEFGNGIFLPS